MRKEGLAVAARLTLSAGRATLFPRDGAVVIVVDTLEASCQAGAYLGKAQAAVLISVESSEALLINAKPASPARGLTLGPAFEALSLVAAASDFARLALHLTDRAIAIGVKTGDTLSTLYLALFTVGEALFAARASRSLSLYLGLCEEAVAIGVGAGKLCLHPSLHDGKRHWLGMATLRGLSNGRDCKQSRSSGAGKYKLDHLLLLDVRGRVVSGRELRLHACIFV